MLVLSRKPRQALLMSNGVRVVVVRVSGDQVRIGVDAPPDVTVVREEIATDKIREELKAAPVPMLPGIVENYRQIERGKLVDKTA